MIEAVRGRLIGPKTWDRIIGILEPFGQYTDCLGFLGCDLCIKSCFGVYEAENDHGFRVHKVEPRLDEWAAHGQPTAGFWDC